MNSILIYSSFIGTICFFVYIIIMYYFEMFKDKLIIEKDKYNTIMELLKNKDEDNARIAMEIVKTLKFKE